MSAHRLPTVDEMAPWLQLGAQAAELAEKLAADAYDLRQLVSGVYTSAPVGVYLHKNANAVTHDGDTNRATPEDYGRVALAIAKYAAFQAVPAGALDNGEWIKVAYSPVLRTLGAYMNFFPGHYPGGIPNSPGPVQGMLTSGLVGAGLGYGTGMAMEQLYPERWQKGRLRKTLGVLGAVPGAALGGLYMLANAKGGRPLTDNSLLSGAPGDMPQMKLSADFNPRYKQALEYTARRFGAGLAGQLKCALGDTFDRAGAPTPITPQDVDIDALGRTLWQGGASPQLMGMTMGALQTAQRMPGDAAPGWVSPQQVGELAAHMGAGYVSGALVGAALGALTGLPESTQQLLARTGMYTGLVRALVPRIYGQ